MIKSIFKKAVLLLSVAVFIASLPVQAAAEPKKLSKDIKAGDTVYFGKYEQDGNKENGKEPIEWMVLDKKGNKALLISKSVLDLKPYHKECDSITWEKCSLRKWLNKEFLKAAFDKKDSKKIQKIKVENKDNKEHRTKGGKATTDSVFLLSSDEANRYFKSNQKRKAEITEYGKKRLAEIWNLTEKEIKEEYFRKDNSNYWYWLRSPGGNQASAKDVSSNGSLYDTGIGVDVDSGGVRPAVWVNL